MTAIRRHKDWTRRTNFPCSKSISAFILSCSVSYAALSGLTEAETGAFTGAFATGAELSETDSPLDFLVPLAADVVFGADMTVRRERDSRVKVCRVCIQEDVVEYLVRMINSGSDAEQQGHSQTN